MGPSGLATVTVATATGVNTATASCGTGRAIGGGASVTGNLLGVPFVLRASVPVLASGVPTGWSATSTAGNSSPGAGITVFAICVP